MMLKILWPSIIFFHTNNPTIITSLILGTFDITESSHLHILPDIKVIKAISYWSRISQWRYVYYCSPWLPYSVPASRKYLQNNCCTYFSVLTSAFTVFNCVACISQTGYTTQKCKWFMNDYCVSQRSNVLTLACFLKFSSWSILVAANCFRTLDILTLITHEMQMTPAAHFFRLYSK